MATRVCRLLRTKGAFGAVVENEWSGEADTSAVFWCLHTMESFGPDEQAVHGAECLPGRRCWQRPDDDEGEIA